MKFQLPWQKEKPVDELFFLETKLDAVLKPVNMRPDFARRLRDQLVGPKEKRVLNLSQENIQNGLLVAGGILSAFLMVMAGLRAIVALLAAFGVLQQVNKNDKGAIPVHSRPAI